MALALGALLGGGWRELPFPGNDWLPAAFLVIIDFMAGSILDLVATPANFTAGGGLVLAFEALGGLGFDILGTTGTSALDPAACS